MRRERFARLFRVLALLLALAFADRAIAAPPGAYPAADIEAARAAIAEYQRTNQKFQDVGWKLVLGNAPYCARTVPAIGLQLQDLASFGEPDFVRAALRMQGDFAVQTAALGSPAAASGAFAPNREIARIDATDPNLWTAAARLDWERVDRAHDWIEAALETKGSIAFAFADGTATTLAPVRVCATRFELVGNSKVARANGTRVFLGTRSPAFGYAEPVFAALVAHELAHNLLGHDAWLDRNKRKQANVRRVEREADRLMPWLLVNGGYDPAAAARFFETYRPHSGGVLFIPGTHDTWRERVEFVEAELPLIRDALAREGRADWAKHFARDAVIEGAAPTPR